MKDFDNAQETPDAGNATQQAGSSAGEAGYTAVLRPQDISYIERQYGREAETITEPVIRFVRHGATHFITVRELLSLEYRTSPLRKRKGGVVTVDQP